MLKGSIVDKENLPRLQAARLYLYFLKNAKLQVRHEKNKNHSWDISAILEHLKDEVQEFEAENDFMKKFLEIADISNMCDILAMALISQQEKKQACNPFQR